MKRLAVIILFLALLLVSCGSGNAEQTTAAGKEETTETRTEETTELSSEFDFGKARIVGYKTVNEGDEFEIEWEGEGFISSHPSVCSLDGKKATASQKGVTLIGIEGTDEAYALCVLPEGTLEDPMAGTPSYLEVGEEAFVEGFGSSEHYTSSDTSVASLNGSVVRALSPGYVVIDVSNISMPKFFSFIVFDRNIG